MRRCAPVLTLFSVLTLLVAACGGGSGPIVDPPSRPTTTIGSPSSTAAPSPPTTGPPTLSSSSSTTTEALPPTESLDGALVFSSVDPPELILVELDGDGLLRVPLDRRLPAAAAVDGDLDGGLLVLLETGGAGKPLVHLPAGAPARDGPILDTWSFQTTRYHHQVAAVYERRTYDTWAEADVDVLETRVEVVVQPLDASTESVLREHTSQETFDRRGNYRNDSPQLVSASSGGGFLVTGWSENDCGWLEIEGVEGDRLPANPYPPGPCLPGWLEARVSRDGSWLVVRLTSPEAGPAITVVDLASGGTVGSLPPGSATSFRYDGETTLVAWGESRPDLGAVLARWPAGAWRTTTLDLDHTLPLVGIIGDRLTIEPEVTAFPPALDTCRIHPITLPDLPDLPLPVARTRGLIAEALGRCDLEALHELAAATLVVGDPAGEDMCGDTTGAPLGDRDLVPILFDRELAALLQLLASEPALTDGSFGRAYVWAEDPGFRIVIGPDGTWINYDYTKDPEPCDTIWCTC